MVTQHDYLLLPRLEVQSANAQSAWWLINAAPVVAASQFAHHLGLKTGARPVGVGLIHHDAQLLGEHFSGRLRPQQRRGAAFIDGHDYSSKNAHALSLQPTASCHLNVSLLLAFAQDDGLPPLPKVTRFLGSARLAGGQVIRHAAIETPAGLEELRAAVRTGFWIVERQDLMAAGDPLDALLHGCRGDAAWVTPTTLGYARLTPAEARRHARGGYPHAFVEPLVGLIQYVPVRTRTELRPPLWRQAWPRDDVFIVTQQEA